MNAKRFVYYNVSLLLVGYVLIHTLYVSLGTTANNISFSNKYLVSSLLPEGWGFFTRSARSRQIVLYKLDPRTKHLMLMTYKSSSADNLLGLSRRSRRIGMEFQRILGRVPDSCWVERKGDPSQPPLSSSPQFVLHYRDLADQLYYLDKGDYLLVSYDPVPWAWASYAGHYTSTFKTTALCLN